MTDLLEHLYRRAAFGLPPHGHRIEDCVDELLAGLHRPEPAEPSGFDAYEPGAAEKVWLDRMLSGHDPLAEKLALFWHGHFATSNQKVQDMGAMWNQYRLFRQAGTGTFQQLLLAVSKDPAMLRWLDGIGNEKAHPNENYGRELMELFTLGVGHYGEPDVRSAARAFTGWTSRVGRFWLDASQHDPAAKRFLARTVVDGEDVVAALCASPQCARYLSMQLLRAFVANPPPEDAVQRAAGTYMKTGGRIDAVMRAILLDPVFRSSRLALVKSPVELLVQALRTSGVRSAPDWAAPALARMGQALFYPPSVKGWPSGTGWLGSLSVVERFQTAALVARLPGAPPLQALCTPEYQLN